MVQDYRNDLIGGRDNSLRLPVLGNIRPGIKRLKNGCSDTDKAIYDSMVKAGAMWHEIDVKLGMDKNGKTKLVPGNETYFTVRPTDCRTNQENAQILHEKYGDPADGQIRRFPIVFLSNEWTENMPHELMCWTARELKYRSKYKACIDQESGESGYERVCMAPVPYKKGVRPFGGRDYSEVRPCKPQTCEEYQRGACKLRGHIQGVIPGTKGAGVWKIETTSYYSLAQIREQMEMVQRITHRLQGLINEKTGEPVFWLRKVTDSISRVDVEKGEAIRTEQDLIYLEADIDMYELITNYQPQRMLERGQKAQALLAGNPVEEPVRPALADPEKPATRPYELKHEPVKSSVSNDVVKQKDLNEKPETQQVTTTADPAQVLDDFIPEIEYLDDQGNSQNKGNTSTEEDKQGKDKLNLVTESAIIRDHYRAELTKCITAARYRELAAEFKSAVDGKLTEEDRAELKGLWEATAARLRGEHAG